jgi:hypothetical protein
MASSLHGFKVGPEEETRAVIEHAAGEERESEHVGAAADALEQAVREIEIAIEYRGGKALIDHPGRQKVGW